MHSPIILRLFSFLLFIIPNWNLLTDGEKQKIIQSVTRLNCNKAQAMAMAMAMAQTQLTYSKWEECGLESEAQWMNERREEKERKKNCARPRAYLLWYTTPNNSSFLKVPSVKWPSMTKIVWKLTCSNTLRIFFHLFCFRFLFSLTLSIALYNGSNVSIRTPLE